MKSSTPSPATVMQETLKQKDAQIQRLKDSLTTEAAQVVQLTAALSTEKDARAQSDEDAERLRELLREAHSLIQSQGEMAIESGALSAALETAENDALVLAQHLKGAMGDIEMIEKAYPDILGASPTNLARWHEAKALIKKYLERENALRQRIAESVATASDEQIEAGMEKLRAAVAEAWIGEGDAPNELTGRTE